MIEKKELQSIFAGGPRKRFRGRCFLETVQALISVPSSSLFRIFEIAGRVVAVALLPAVCATCGDRAMAQPLEALSVQSARSSAGERLDGQLMLAEAARNDARINDLCFVSARRGWAVGDHGAIWATDDGGRTWLAQNSGVACPLYSVCFVDDNIGWAAGGGAHPFSHNGYGVLLFTRDGGRSWRHFDKLLLPLLRRVRFFDARRGVAVACPSAMFPGGLLATDSGGQAWHPLGGEVSGNWLDGDFVEMNLGGVAGRQGRFAALRQGELKEPGSISALRGLWRMTLAGEHGWLVGDGGLVMTSNDLGALWRLPASPLPESAAQQFDFRAVATVDTAVWIAGAPGSRIWHSPDGGRSWLAQATGVTVPLHAVSFVDRQRGFAAGALGTIIATEDGGRTWSVQRCGGNRAALLGVFADPRDVPLELFARLCGFEGYFGVVELPTRRDLDCAAPPETSDEDRLREAILRVGGCDARLGWQFPLRQRGVNLTMDGIVELWDRATDRRGLSACEADLCRSIRQWRPEIVVTYDADPRSADPASHLINQLVLAAIRSAADPTKFSNQLTEAGLEPWAVPKVFAIQPAASRGGVELATTQFWPRAGRSPAELAALPRGLLRETFVPSPAVISFRLILDQSGRDQSDRDFFSGRPLTPGGGARRALPPSAVQNLDALRRAAEKRRNVQAIIARLDADPQSGVSLLGQAGELTLGLEPDAAAEVLFLLADGFQRRGRWLEAADTLNMLAERYPRHPLARTALTWLVQFYSGSEPARRLGLGGNAAAVANEVRASRAARAAELGRLIERQHPDLYALPQVRFPLAVAWRAQGYPQQADRFYALWQRQAGSPAWRTCAGGELWLADPRGAAPKPVLPCAAVAGKPLLDGRLDDDVWRRARSAAMVSPLADDHEWPAVAYLAYDREYLYLAVRCRKAPKTLTVDAPGSPGGVRPRDPDLSGRDRFVLLLDLDRDFATYYQLEIDDRGWAAESCWGDRTWNPKWYVGSDSEPKQWTAEAAIAWEELTDRPPESRDVWAVSLQRVVPWAGMQSWSAPASVEVAPEGFGYLIFE